MFNLFKKKTKSKDISNPIDNINIDNYKDLDMKEKEYVNNLINEYKQLFKENNSIIDIDKYLNKEFIMYQELIINIISNLDDNTPLENIISLLKLKVYLDELNNIYDKLKYKLISLKEIKNNKEYIRSETIKYYLGKRKININTSLSNFIDNISLSLVNTYTLINIVNKEIINISSISINTNLDNYNKDITNKLNKTNNYYTLLFNNELNIDNNLTKLVLEEIELEKFTHLNKDKKKDLLNKLNDISNIEIQSKEEQLNIINNLLQIKTYFNVFNTYGRNIIKEEELKELYNIIFNTYTYFPYDCDEFINYCNNINDYELDYYNKIIDFKKELLLQGKSPALESINNNDKENIINLLNDYGIRRNVPIPLQPHILSLLLSLEEENELENYFKYSKNNHEKKIFNEYLQNKIVIKGYYPFIKPLNSLCKNNNINLYNIYKLYIGIFDKNDTFTGLYDDYDYYSYIYKIFKIFFRNKLDFNIIPDGIETFHTYDFDKYLEKCNKNKPIILPDTTLDITIKDGNYNYILPKEVNNLYLQIKSNNIPQIVLPSKINKSFVNLNKVTTINFIHRKEILEMNNNELKNYLLNIYSRDIMQISNSNIKELEYSYKNLNKILGSINILNNEDNIINIPINYDDIMYLWEENNYFILRTNAIINSIIKSINNYKNLTYKKLNLTL